MSDDYANNNSSDGYESEGAQYPTLMFIRNKKTGHLLAVNVESEETYDYGYGGETVQGTRTFIQLDDLVPEHEDAVFCTYSEYTVEQLLSKGACRYPDIRIDFGYGKNKFELSDLEVVKTKVK